jgi:hypothetical protein
MSTVQMLTMNMRARQLATQRRHFMIVLSLLSVCLLGALMRNGRSHIVTPQHQEPIPDQQSRANALVKIVRESTERFKQVSVAEAEGYALQFGCVSGPDAGAIGLQFVNEALVNTGEIDATRPQIVIYEPTPNRGLRLIGADFLVLADQWNAKHSSPPELMGQLFHYFEFPNRFGLPAFYTLHVWAWKENPNGAFVNWHPNVSCEQFAGQAP